VYCFVCSINEVCLDDDISCLLVIVTREITFLIFFINVKPDHINKNLAMLRKIHGINFLHIKLLNRNNIKCQNGPVLSPAQVFYFNGQALHKFNAAILFLVSSVMYGQQLDRLVLTVNYSQSSVLYRVINKVENQLIKFDRFV
jgi:hypothetical protein